MYSDEEVISVFQEEVMTSTSKIFELPAQFLVDTFNVMEEVQLVHVTSLEEEQPDDAYKVEEQKW